MMDAYVGKVVYALGYTLSANKESISNIEVFNNRRQLKRVFSRNSAAVLGEISLLHGILTRASSIPDKITGDVDIFLLVPNANDDFEGYIVQCISIKYLQQVVEALVRGAVEDGIEYIDEIIDITTDIDVQEIDELYVLYGYEIALQYSFSDEDIDEEIIDQSKKVYKNIKGLQNAS